MATPSPPSQERAPDTGSGDHGLEAAVRRLYAALATGEVATAANQPALAEAASEGPKRLAEVAERAADELAVSSGEVAYADEILESGLHRTLFMSREAERYLGLSIPAGADVRAIWRAAVHVEDRLAESAFVCRLARGGPAEARYRVVARDGTVRHVCDRAWPRREPAGAVMVLGVVRELPGLSEADAFGHERLAAIAEVIDDALWEGEVTDAGTIRLRYVSPGLERLLGAPVARGAAAVGELMSIWREAVHPDDRAVLDDCRSRLARGEPAEARYRLRALDGRQRDLWARGRSRRAPDGRLIVAGIVTDVSDGGRRASTTAPVPPAFPAGPAHDGLTPRQLQILELLAAGVSTGEVAGRLGLTVTTVRNHANRILRALGAHSRLEAVARARERGLL